MSNPSGLDDLDGRLLALLTEDARRPVADLARRLGVARSTVQERIDRLRRSGTITGFTVRLGPEAAGRRISAQVQMAVDPKRADTVVSHLRAIAAVRTLHTVSGPFDLVALVAADTTAELDAALDAIGRTPGIERTTSAIVLTTKLDR